MTAPERIGRYQIVRRIGKSMTEVYLAVDTQSQRTVVLKLVKDDGTRVSRLVLEAERRGAAIQRDLHAVDPRMIEIYETGEQDGCFFVAMQYVEGQNLAEVLHKDPGLEPIRAAAIALEICEQLAKIHSWQSTVVHGDIKPSNIHLGPHDTVRLLDFGIAKRLRTGPDGVANATNHNFGSPGYCSPERLLRSEVDPQSDLWALGATLYEMLAGVPPYQADNTAKLESLIRSKRPPRALPNSCPRGLRAIVSKSLAPQAARRYPCAADMQADLQAFLEHRPTVAERERRSWSANATLEAAREALRRASRTVARGRARLKAPGAAASFAAGMALWIGGTFGWQALQARHAPPPPVVAPPPVPTIDLPHLYLAEGEYILSAYRDSQDNALAHFDFPKAELCLNAALQLGTSAPAIQGELAMARGYAILERLDGSQYSPAARTQWRDQSRAQFETAAQALPQSPDPHLALARLWVYQSTDLDRAMAEFAAAEKLGAMPGRRATEQQADAYRLRAERLKSLQDAQTARALYQRIPGFDDADRHLKELARHRSRTYHRRSRWR